jgi:hypothetical protein
MCIKRDSLYCDVLHSKAKISKVDYSSKDKSFNLHDFILTKNTVPITDGTKFSRFFFVGFRRFCTPTFACPAGKKTI